jgi:hypothetical protein
MEEFKVCSACGLELPTLEFYKFRGAPAAACKACSDSRSSSLTERYRAINLARFHTVEWMRTEKACARCKQIKRHYDFSKVSTNRDGCDSYCKDCKSKTQRGKRRCDPWDRLRYYATSRKLACTLSRQEYCQIVEPNCCTYCFGPLPNYGGLDRIDNSRGYEPGNVVPCCTDCNRIRGCALTHEEMLELAPKLREILAKRAAKSSLVSGLACAHGL